MNRKATCGMLAAAVWGATIAAAQAPVEDGVATLATVPVATRGAVDGAAYDGVVEALRHTTIAAQVSGAVIAVAVKAGDRVQAGQVLLRLDSRAAEQQAGAAAAQVQAARAAQDAAAQELERQRQLFRQRYISQAALERAEAQAKATQAQAAAQLAAAEAARTQSGFYVVKAPYDGIVAEVAVVLGDMAMPGRRLLAVYDPAALRVTATVPETVAARLATGQALSAELPVLSPERVVPVRWEVLPAADPATHTVELRLDLPRGTAATPGTFARVRLPAAGGELAHLSVPARSVVRRAELNGVYVLAPDGRPLLRQVRLGHAAGDQVEVLSGLAAGERVVSDPQAAARVH
jgi:multidrug efflux system membrane fusion protein